MDCVFFCLGSAGEQFAGASFFTCDVNPMTIDRLREEFPHTQRFIYLNHAGTGPLSRRVVGSIEAFIEERHLTHIDNFERFLPRLADTRRCLAGLIGAGPNHVEFCTNTSSALNLLASGLPWQPGDHVAFPGCEFPANVYPFLNLERKGVHVDIIPHTDSVVKLEEVEKVLTPRTRVLSISWVQFLSGFRTDLKVIGELCRDNGTIFCVDAIQGLGALRMDVTSCNIGFLACGVQKWMLATQGNAFLYVRDDVLDQIDPPAGWLQGPVDWDHFLDYDLRFYPDARRFNLGTRNHMAIAGLHGALELYEEAGFEWCENRVLSLATRLAAGFDCLGCERYGTYDETCGSGIVTIKHPSAVDLFRFLSENGIVISLRQGMLRFSPTYYNTEEEIDRTIETVGAFGNTRFSV